MSQPPEDVGGGSSAADEPTQGSSVGSTEPLAELGSEADDPDVDVPAEDLGTKQPVLVEDSAPERPTDPELDPAAEPAATAETPVEAEVPPALTPERTAGEG